MKPTWKNQLIEANKMSTADLERHAAVSTGNNHRCEDCFCCAALTVIEERAGLDDDTRSGCAEQTCWCHVDPQQAGFFCSSCGCTVIKDEAK